MTQQAQAAVFAALGDPLRLAIVMRLSQGGPLPTMRLREAAGELTRQAVNKHLSVLEQVGLVASFRAGRDRHWQLHPEPLAEARGCLDRINAEWNARIERLRALVEDDH